MNDHLSLGFHVFIYWKKNYKAKKFQYILTSQYPLQIIIMYNTFILYLVAEIK